jgi:periplasmic divalent cation tolerance protein
MSDDQLIECTTTFGSEDEARRCAMAVVEQKLVACAQILGPIESFYRWQGSVHQDREWKLTMKTTMGRKADLLKAIAALHSYQEPEILVLPVLDASEGYARWLREQTTTT